MKSYIALFCAFSLWEPLSAAPTLDLPRELVMDVNKPPYPVVNIIADQPSAGVGSFSGETMRLKSSALAAYKEQAHEEMQTQHHQLERLSRLRAGTTNRVPETLPVVNVRLAPPKNPLPEVSAEIAVLEQQREKLETEFTDKLQTAFDAALASAKSRISKMVAASMQLLGQASMRHDGGLQTSFLQAGETDFAVKLSTVAIPPADPSVKIIMDKIESKRSAAESKVLAQACSEMQGLTDIVLNELGAQIQSNALALQNLNKKVDAAGFLAVSHQERSKALPEQANVRVEAGSAFPTIASMVQAMESRRDTAESQEASKVLEMELKLLQEENDMIKNAMSIAVQRITG